MFPAQVVLAALSALGLLAVEPEATFAVVDGRLVVHLSTDQIPVAGAGVRCLVDTQLFASDTTDMNGRATLPRPSKDWCQVVFDLGEGPMAPIPLTFLSDGDVAPKSLPVRRGAAECCLVRTEGSFTEARSVTPSDSTYELLIDLGIGSIAALLLYAFLRRCFDRPSRDISRHTTRKRRKHR